MENVDNESGPGHQYNERPEEKVQGFIVFLAERCKCFTIKCQPKDLHREFSRSEIPLNCCNYITSDTA